MKSKPANNIEGRSERDLQQQRRMDKALCSHYKRRHRKDLTAAEIEKIVAAADKPFTMHKDVAQQFSVSSALVSGLVREAKKMPEKEQQLRQREQ